MRIRPKINQIISLLHLENISYYKINRILALFAGWEADEIKIIVLKVKENSKNKLNYNKIIKIVILILKFILN